MRTVMRRTGLTADTIRVWERRYGVVVPLRTGGNARRYSESDVQRLLSLREGVASGRSIGELARLSIDDLASLASVSPQAAHGESTSLVARYLDALRAFDVSTAEDLLSRCLLLAPSALVFEVAVPVLRALGNGWENGSVSIAEEHLATFQLRTLFAAALGGKRAARGAPAVVFAAPEGHAHELGVLMAATLALEHGLRPVCLGANTPTAELVLEDCRVPDECLLGGEDSYRSKEGFMTAMKTFDNTRPIVAAMAIGIGRAAYEYARDFVKENYALSRHVPRYSAIAERLAKVGRNLEAARLVTWRAGWMADQGIANAKEASMSKALGGQAAIQACIEAIEICGVEGTLQKEHQLLEKWFRDIKVYDIFEGTGQIQRIVISKRLISDLKSF